MSGKLPTTDLIERVKAHIDARWKRQGCMLCGENDWTLADGYTRLELSEFGGPAVIGQRAVPCVAMVCNNCGNTVLLNLKILGLKDG